MIKESLVVEFGGITTLNQLLNTKKQLLNIYKWRSMTLFSLFGLRKFLSTPFPNIYKIRLSESSSTPFPPW